MLFALGMEAYEHGVSTLKVDDTQRALDGMSGIGSARPSLVRDMGSLKALAWLGRVGATFR